MPKHDPGLSPDERFMSAALREAEKAARLGEIPVGAVVTRAGKIIARGHNRVEARRNACLHAEMLALQQAARKVGDKRLEGCDLYVTLEPCAMCAGAAVWSRVRRIVYGAADPKAGACGSVLTVAGCRKLNHRPELIPGVLAGESSGMLKDFFRELRENKTTAPRQGRGLESRK
jgi:tRNA(adenine34) deaminase